MASNIDKKLFECGMLDKLKINSKKYLSIKESKSLVATFEQHVFVWHDAGSCILTSEISNNEINETIKKIAGTPTSDCTSKQSFYKTLTLTNPPVFEVDSLIFNQTGSLLALSGKHGVTIYEIPWRYGKFGTTTEKSEYIIGRSWNIAELFFMSTNRVQVIQTAWHPGSTSKTHITILSSDNYIRFYDVTDPQTPEQAIALGLNCRNSFLSSESKITFSSCYGENAVSFDFGPPENMEIFKSVSRSVKESEMRTVWPIYLLHGNGDVYILKTPLKKQKFQSSHKLHGPLVMFPPAEDNYGYDACTILCLHSIPPTIIIATATGVIYHSLVLDNANSNVLQEDQTNLHGNQNSEDCNEALYVFESVELPLTLSEEQDDVYTNPIRLYKDIVSHSKYYCTHVSGLHSVAMPFVQSLEDEDHLKQVLNDKQKQPCIVEHILCTKPFSQMKAVPVLGLDCTVTDGGIILVCLLATWEFVSFSIVSSFLPPMPNLLSEESSKTKEDKHSIMTFEQSLEKAMQRSLCSPFVKSFPSTKDAGSSPQQWLDLLCNVTQRFREDYIQRLTTAHALLQSRVKVLSQQKEYQLNDIKRCEKEKEDLKSGVEQLAEKFEDAQGTQQDLQKRIENVLKKLPLQLPYLSKAEIEMKQTLLSYEEKIKFFDSSLEQIKKKLKYQREKSKEFVNNLNNVLPSDELKNVHFNETQTKHVKELLTQEGEAVAQLMENVNLLKKQLGLG